MVVELFEPSCQEFQDLDIIIYNKNVLFVQGHGHHFGNSKVKIVPFGLLGPCLMVPL